MDIAREICTDNFYTVNSGAPRIPVTAVTPLPLYHGTKLLLAGALMLPGEVNISQLQGEFEFNTFLVDKPYY